MWRAVAPTPLSPIQVGAKGVITKSNGKEVISVAKKLAAYAGRSLRDPQVRSGAISPLTLVAYRHRGTHQLVKAGEQPVAAPTMLVEELTDTYSVLYDLDATGRVADFVEVGTP